MLPHATAVLGRVSSAVRGCRRVGRRSQVGLVQPRLDAQQHAPKADRRSPGLRSRSQVVALLRLQQAEADAAVRPGVDVEELGGLSAQAIDKRTPKAHPRWHASEGRLVRIVSWYFELDRVNAALPVRAWAAVRKGVQSSGRATRAAELSDGRSTCFPRHKAFPLAHVCRAVRQRLRLRGETTRQAAPAEVLALRCEACRPRSAESHTAKQTPLPALAPSKCATRLSRRGFCRLPGLLATKVKRARAGGKLLISW